MKNLKLFVMGLSVLTLAGCVSATRPPEPEAAEALRAPGTIIFTDETGVEQGVDKILKVVLVQETPDDLTFDVTYSYSGQNADKAYVGVYPDMSQWSVTQTPVLDGTHTVSVQTSLQREVMDEVKSTSLRLEIDGYRGKNPPSAKYQYREYLGALYRRIVPFPKTWSHGEDTRSASESAKYYSDMADGLFEEGNLREAHEAYLKAEKYSASTAEKTRVYGSLTVTFYEMGEYASAKEYCKKLLDLSPGNQWAKDWLAKIDTAMQAPEALSRETQHEGYGVNIGMYYNGSPLSDLTRSMPRFSLHERKTNKSYTKNVSYDTGTGKLVASGLEAGSYHLTAAVDADSGNPDDFPGDYQGGVLFDVPYKGGSSPSLPSAVDGEVPFNIDKIIHMTAPQDNAAYIAEKWLDCGEEIILSSPVRIEWEPLAEGVEYSYVLTRYTCKPFRSAGVVKSSTLTETSISLDVPSTGEGEIYVLELKAFKGNMKIGHLMTRTKNSTAWDYRFRIRASGP